MRNAEQIKGLLGSSEKSNNLLGIYWCFHNGMFADDIIDFLRIDNEHWDIAEIEIKGNLLLGIDVIEQRTYERCFFDVPLRKRIEMIGLKTIISFDENMFQLIEFIITEEGKRYIQMSIKK